VKTDAQYIVTSSARQRRWNAQVSHIEGGAGSACEEYPIEHYISHVLNVPTAMENDANLLALGDAERLDSDELPLISFQVSYGMGSGVVSNSGEVYY
jgi:predicted NBD/HSP70 family sugar kinase